MNRISILWAAGVLSLLALIRFVASPFSLSAEPTVPADYVIHNARIYTVAPSMPVAEAMAVRGDRILLVGGAEQILTLYSDANRIDLEGRTVVPGLIDAHAHLSGLAESLIQASLSGTRSVADIIERLQDSALLLPEGSWITGRGWDQNDWRESAFPTRADLDHAFPDRPVWLQRIDGHAAWANSAALRAAGLDRIRSAADPPGGQILRDDAGEPTGIFIDAAMALVDEFVPEPTGPEREIALQRALEQTARSGITSVHDAGIDLPTIERYREAIEEGRFNLRVYGMIDGPGETFRYFCENGPLMDVDSRLIVRSVKLYVDGALGSRGASLLEPYSDQPDHTGLLQMSPEELTETIVESSACGFQVSTHAIGDKGVRIALNAYEQASDRLGMSYWRHRIEHAQIVHPNDVPRFAALGVIASMQPTHATSDMYWAEDRLGEDRLQGAYAWKSILDSGARLAFGSDFPVEEVDPRLGIYAAEMRQDTQGWPAGGWLPQERLTREQALHAFTLGAAYAAFQEDVLGSLEPGKFADFVVLSDDIMTIPAERILSVSVESTYLGGKRIYHKEDDVK